MGIDILYRKVDDAALLAELGEGDWIITMPNNYPDLIVTIAWRQDILKQLGHQFVRWVLDGTDVEIDHNYDPPWDHSGHAREFNADPLMLLTRYSTLDEWLENAHTGHSQATFTSNCVLHWETFEDDFRDRVSRAIYDRLREHVMTTIPDVIEAEVWWDIYENEVCEIDIHLQPLMRLWVSGMTTAEMWQRYLGEVRSLIGEEQRQQEILSRVRGQQRELVRAFCQQHFADLIRQRIEMPQFSELKIEERLQEVLLDADPEIAKAIVEVGLPCNFSNRAKLIVEGIAKAALL